MLALIICKRDDSSIYTNVIYIISPAQLDKEKNDEYKINF